MTYDYYTGGMMQPDNRCKNPDEYRFAYNGKPMDNDVMNITGAWYDYGMRPYNSLINRPPCPDPLTKKYPELSPYQFFSNSPIANIDLDGKEALSSEAAFYDALGTVQQTLQNQYDVIATTTKNAATVVGDVVSNLFSERTPGTVPLGVSIVGKGGNVKSETLAPGGKAIEIPAAAWAPLNLLTKSANSSPKTQGDILKQYINTEKLVDAVDQTKQELSSLKPDAKSVQCKTCAAGKDPSFYRDSGKTYVPADTNQYPPSGKKIETHLSNPE